jgi:hypothetical protein
MVRPLRQGCLTLCLRFAEMTDVFLWWWKGPMGEERHKLSDIVDLLKLRLQQPEVLRP